MKHENENQERKLMKAMKSLGISGLIMLAAVLGLMRVFFVEEKAQSMERKRPTAAEHEAFRQAMDECMETVDVDENGRPDREAVETCMSEKGFERPAGPPGGQLMKGPAGFTPPPYPGSEDENGSDTENEQ